MKKIDSIYVIDDDKIYHFLLKNLLKQNGVDAKSTFFANGQDAIDFIKQNNHVEELPDLILLDVNMPIMNGWQFLDEFIKLGPGLSKMPVIYMISSSNNEVDIERAKEFNGTVKDYFLKPICKEDIEKIFVL
ncbi:response regulator [Flavobacterium album]|uniref:Response regulator n=1 Tax=Flavobacterium album TaxID=2175091 RepID=A0A2S1QTA7_9FLAO|nr:response regulator [Flavobacterium album]AWH83658.1 response regulator [Flavobacterium album]